MKNNLRKYIRKDIASLEEYIPGESASDVSDRFGVAIDKLIKLNANENPYGPSPLAMDAAKNVLLQFYPPSDYKNLRESIGTYCRINASRIILGSGSDELIDLLLRLVLEKGDKVLTCPPTFGMYEIFTKLNAGKVITIPRNQDYSIDVEKIVKNIKKNVKVIFICNPNNPTGTITTNKDIEILLKTNRLVVVDEAYCEFADQSAIAFVKKYPNLVILRTFSKWAGLAGIRIGYGIMDQFLVERLMNIKSPFNVNVVAEKAAIATLDDLTFAKKTIQKIIFEREKMYVALSSINKIMIFPSAGNFLFVKVKYADYQKIKNVFEENKIALRYYQSSLLCNGIRITVGRPKQNKKIIQIFKDFYE